MMDFTDVDFMTRSYYPNAPHPVGGAAAAAARSFDAQHAALGERPPYAPALNVRAVDAVVTQMARGDPERLADLRALTSVFEDMSAASREALDIAWDTMDLFRASANDKRAAYAVLSNAQHAGARAAREARGTEERRRRHGAALQMTSSATADALLNLAHKIAASDAATTAQPTAAKTKKAAAAASVGIVLTQHEGVRAAQEFVATLTDDGDGLRVAFDAVRLFATSVHAGHVTADTIHKTDWGRQRDAARAVPRAFVAGMLRAGDIKTPDAAWFGVFLDEVERLVDAFADEHAAAVFYDLVETLITSGGGGGGAVRVGAPQGGGPAVSPRSRRRDEAESSGSRGWAERAEQDKLRRQREKRARARHATAHQRSTFAPAFGRMCDLMLSLVFGIAGQRKVQIFGWICAAAVIVLFQRIMAGPGSAAVASGDPDFFAQEREARDAFLYQVPPAGAPPAPATQQQQQQQFDLEGIARLLETVHADEGLMGVYDNRTNGIDLRGVAKYLTYNMAPSREAYFREKAIADRQKEKVDALLGHHSASASADLSEWEQSVENLRKELRRLSDVAPVDPTTLVALAADMQRVDAAKGRCVAYVAAVDDAVVAANGGMRIDRGSAAGAEAVRAGRAPASGYSAASAAAVREDESFDARVARLELALRDNPNMTQLTDAERHALAVGQITAADKAACELDRKWHDATGGRETAAWRAAINYRNTLQSQARTNFQLVQTAIDRLTESRGEFDDAVDRANREGAQYNSHIESERLLKLVAMLQDTHQKSDAGDAAAKALLHGYVNHHRAVFWALCRRSTCSDMFDHVAAQTLQASADGWSMPVIALNYETLAGAGYHVLDRSLGHVVDVWNRVANIWLQRAHPETPGVLYEWFVFEQLMNFARTQHVLSFVGDLLTAAVFSYEARVMGERLTAARRRLARGSGMMHKIVLPAWAVVWGGTMAKLRGLSVRSNFGDTEHTVRVKGTYRITVGLKAGMDVLTATNFGVSALVSAFALLGRFAPTMDHALAPVYMIDDYVSTQFALGWFRYAVYAGVGVVAYNADAHHLIVNGIGWTATKMWGGTSPRDFTRNAEDYVEKMRRAYGNREYPVAKLLFQAFFMGALVFPIATAMLRGHEETYLADNQELLLGNFVKTQVYVEGGATTPSAAFAQTDAWMEMLKRAAVNATTGAPPDFDAALQSVPGQFELMNITDLSENTRRAIANLLRDLVEFRGRYAEYGGITSVADAGAGAVAPFFPTGAAAFGTNGSASASARGDGPPVTDEERRIYRDLFVRRNNPSRPFAVTMTRLVELVLQK